MESKMLKPYKCMEIEKSYALKADGSINKNTVIYTAYDTEGNVFDGAKTLTQLKNKIDRYA